MTTVESVNPYTVKTFTDTNMIIEVTSVNNDVIFISLGWYYSGNVFIKIGLSSYMPKYKKLRCIYTTAQLCFIKNFTREDVVPSNAIYNILNKAVMYVKRYKKQIYDILRKNTDVFYNFTTDITVHGGGYIGPYSYRDLRDEDFFRRYDKFYMPSRYKASKY